MCSTISSMDYKWISVCHTFIVYFLNRLNSVRIMFSFESYSVKKTKQINKPCLPIRGCSTVLPQWQPTTVRAHFHLILALSFCHTFPVGYF